MRARGWLIVSSGVLRNRSGSAAPVVTHVELFFDLVSVFAVTQLSHHPVPGPVAARRDRCLTALRRGRRRGVAWQALSSRLARIC